MKSLFPFLFILLTINAIGQSFTPSGPLPLSDRAKLDSLLDFLDQNHKLMGTVTLTRGGQLIYNKAIGYRSLSLSNAAYNDTLTRYRVGSITKMFTATMIFQLIEEGKLTLSTPLSQFYPDIPHADKITIDLMLTHHSGLHNVTDDTDYAKWAYQPITEQQLLEKFRKDPPAFEPGAKGEYSNTNFILLGFIIEKLTHVSYLTALNQRIIFKAHLLHTTVGGRIDPANDEAFSYAGVDSNWTQQPETDMSVPGGAGCITSTAQDIDLFLTALFSGQLISDSSLGVMKTSKDGFGHGIFSTSLMGMLSYGHNGGIDAFRSISGYLPDDQVALTILSNASDYLLNILSQLLLKIYYHKPYEWPDFSHHYITLPADSLARYTGQYASLQIPLGITIGQDKGSLTGQATGQGAFPLSAVNDREFHFDQAGITITFTIGVDGKVTGFQLKQGAGTYMFSRK